jgi:hypothetical protein
METMGGHAGIMMAARIAAPWVLHRSCSENSSSLSDSPPCSASATGGSSPAIEHERRVTVWYKSCPEVPGINPEVFVIWPGRLLYTLDLAKSQLTLKGEVLQVSTPPIEVEEPAVPSDLAQFAANNPFWNLSTDASIGNAAIRKATPVARYLSIYFLKHDPTLRGYFSKELEVYLRGVAGALNVPVREVAVDIAEAKVPTPVLPALELCSGTTASANGVPFLREQDGDTIYVFPRAQQ